MRTLPPFVTQLDEKAQRAFEYALGRELFVEQIDERGNVVLLLGDDADDMLGGVMNDIRVEPRYVELLRP